jgi:hypothetical protein
VFAARNHGAIQTPTLCARTYDNQALRTNTPTEGEKTNGDGGLLDDYSGPVVVRKHIHIPEDPDYRTFKSILLSLPRKLFTYWDNFGTRGGQMIFRCEADSIEEADSVFEGTLGFNPSSQPRIGTIIRERPWN